ncbi:hypothetical protein BH09PLA1_BH09PLA1_28000 [soil metagenome]
MARRTPRDLFRWHAPRVGWFTLGGFVAGIAYLMTTNPAYTAKARINVPLPAPELEIAAAMGGSAPQPNREKFLATQAQLITSDAILKHVGEHLTDAEKLKTLRRYDGDVEEFLRDYLIVAPNENAEIIELSLKAVREDDAIKLVNAVTETFMLHQGVERRTVAGDLLRTLRDTRAAITQQIVEAQAQVDQHKCENPNVSLEASVTMTKNKIQALSDQLTQCQLATLRTQQSFAPDHPARQKALQLEVDVSNAINSAQDEAMQLNAQFAEQRDLEAQLQQHRTAAAQIDKRIENLELQRDSEAARIHITVIEPGRVTHASLSAMPLSATGLFMTCGAVAGLAWSVHSDGSDRRMRCANDVRAALGETRILGVVPLMPKRRSHIGKAMATHLDPRGSAAEGHRTVRTSLLSAPGARRTILVTSPKPGDGKSVCATNLALALTQAGRTVVLVDADLRRPTQHVNLDLRDGAGLTDALRSTAALRWAIQPSGIDNLDALPAGSTKQNPSELLDSPEFRALLTELGARYDHVVIDSPPINVVNYAALIAGYCDATVLVVRAEHTTRDDAARALEMLTKVGGRVVGAVVNAAPTGDNFGVYGGSYFATVDTALRQSAVSAVPARPAKGPHVRGQLQPV